MQYQKVKSLIITSCFLLVLGSPAVAFDLTKVNFSYLYDHDPVKINYQIAKQDSLYKLILTFHLVKILPSNKMEEFELYQQRKIGSGSEQLITPLSQKLDSGFVKNTVEMDFYANEESGYLVLRFLFLEKEYLYGIPINASLTFPLSNIIYRLDTPAMFYNGYKNNDRVIFENINNSEKGYFSYLYQENFSPALPPMVVDGNVGSQRLSISSIIPFNDSLTLEESNYLYFIQNDTSSDQGVSILSHPDYYPKIKSIEELIAPLVYICTGDEFEELNANENKKLAFNNFWLDHISGKELASKTIKKYFRSVKFANAFFTGYKNGWKTDRGMIYIAFGPPENIKRKEKEEIWEYATFDGELKFTFAKKPNLFVQHHYTLVREKSLNNVWFKAIQKWRKGDL
jgi:GWxTD domain-containing protein